MTDSIMTLSIATLSKTLLCCYAEYRKPIILSVITPSVIMLNVVAQRSLQKD